MTMRFLLSLIALGGVLNGQRTNRINYLRLPLDSRIFESCAEVEKVAREADPPTKDRVYTIELFARKKGAFSLAFPSEHSVSDVTQWIAANKNKTFPTAMFYAVDGRYKFRCRDSQNRLSQTTGAEGDPLQLSVTGGKAEIWHFDLYNVYMAHLYVVTDVPLDKIDGKDVLAQASRKLGARFAFLYIRRDPWFYEHSLDATPYIFSDWSKVLDGEQYRATQTLDCMTGHGCSFASHHD
jgi:hypothetical protein